MSQPRFLLLFLLTVMISLAGCGGGQQAPPAEQASEQAAPSAAPSEPIDPATVGEVTGKVAFQGQAPARVRIRMDAVPACTEASKEPVFSEEVVVNDNGTLQNVFVYVKDGLGNRTFPVPSEPVVLDQKGCVYHPHVLGLVAGQKLAIKNSDPTNHNVHPMPAQNREWNKSQPPGAPDMEEQFPRPEIMVPIKCNVHPWMKAYVGVLRHPFFAVTDQSGSFSLKGLPPGDYTIEAWHEKYGTMEQKVTIGPKEAKTLEFSFQG
ncbi:MAG: carboxypeptidase regulatory-like domain-containing protein [Acidobacteria bacterium]|nr:carboxypeptidase regulatory-like domain-containing protein [Acidobacteriota bacterium]